MAIALAMEAKATGNLCLATLQIITIIATAIITTAIALAIAIAVAIALALTIAVAVAIAVAMEARGKCCYRRKIKLIKIFFNISV